VLVVQAEGHVEQYRARCRGPQGVYVSFQVQGSTRMNLGEMDLQASRESQRDEVFARYSAHLHGQSAHLSLRTAKPRGDGLIHRMRNGLVARLIVTPVSSAQLLFAIAARDLLPPRAIV
jgi:hypothetical protein